jgi:hypothetical protein
MTWKGIRASGKVQGRYREGTGKVHDLEGHQGLGEVDEVDERVNEATRAIQVQHVDAPHRGLARKRDRCREREEEWLVLLTVVDEAD